MKLIPLLLIPLHLSTNPAPERKKDLAQFEYSEHIRRKLNCILEIEDGSNYWEFKNKTKDKELLIKKYLER